MNELAEFTHLVEDVLDGVRSGKAAVTEAVIDALLASIDVIKAMLDSRSEGNPYGGDTTGVKATLASLPSHGRGQGRREAQPRIPSAHCRGCSSEQASCSRRIRRGALRVRYARASRGRRS